MSNTSRSIQQSLCQHLDLWSSKNNVKYKIRPPTNTGVLGKQLLGYRIYIKEPRCSSSRQVNIQPYSAFLKHPGFITTSPQARGLCEPVSPMTLMGAKVTRLGENFERSESGANFQGGGALPPPRDPVRVLGDGVHPEEGGRLVPGVEDEDGHRQARTSGDHQHKLHRCFKPRLVFCFDSPKPFEGFHIGKSCKTQVVVFGCSSISAQICILEKSTIHSTVFLQYLQHFYRISPVFLSIFSILEKYPSTGDGDILLEWRRPATTHGRVNFYVIYYKSDQVSQLFSTNQYQYLQIYKSDQVPRLNVWASFVTHPFFHFMHQEGWVLKYKNLF